jgi:hypothetical protein
MVAKDLTDLELPTFGRTIRGQVAEVDGKTVAATGVLHTSPFYAFAHITPAMRDHPRAIVRVIQGFEEFLTMYYGTVYAIADVNENNAPAVLERAGFKHYQTSLEGEVYRWQQPQYH